MHGHTPWPRSCCFHLPIRVLASSNAGHAVICGQSSHHIVCCHSYTECNGIFGADSSALGKPVVPQKLPHQPQGTLQTLSPRPHAMGCLLLSLVFERWPPLTGLHPALWLFHSSDTGKRWHAQTLSKAMHACQGRNKNEGRQRRIYGSLLEGMVGSGEVSI